MRRDAEALRDVIAAAQAIRRFLAGVDEARFMDDELLQSAVVQKLTVIGEAARRVSADLTGGHPEVEWQFAIPLRNVVVHEYFAVSWATIWQTAVVDVPGLARQVAGILERLPGD